MVKRSLGVARRQPNFVGSFRHVVDAQGRIQLPRMMRKAMPPESQNTLIVTRGLDGCLWAYPLDGWQGLLEQWQRAVDDSTAREKRNAIRLITSQASETHVDAQGRISIPTHLLDAADIRKEAMVVGSLDRIELWNPKRFEKTMLDVEDSFEETVGRLRVYRPTQTGSDAG